MNFPLPEFRKENEDEINKREEKERVRERESKRVLLTEQAKSLLAYIEKRNYKIFQNQRDMLRKAIQYLKETLKEDDPLEIEAAIYDLEQVLEIVEREDKNQQRLAKLYKNDKDTPYWDR